MGKQDPSAATVGTMSRASHDSRLHLSSRGPKAYLPCLLATCSVYYREADMSDGWLVVRPVGWRFAVELR